MEGYIVSDDKSRLDLRLIHKFLSASRWAKGRSFEAVKKSIENSFCFGIYITGKQIGFARVVSDLTTLAYIMDVFIVEEYRGKGYSIVLLQKILNDEQFSSVKKWMLSTKDAHTLYEKFGFRKIKQTRKLMEKILD